MGEVITKEIDLRPLWRQRGGWGSGAGGRSTWSVAAGAAGGLLLGFLAFGGEDPPPPAPRAAPAPAVVQAAVAPAGDGRREEEAPAPSQPAPEGTSAPVEHPDEPAPIRDDAPIVIEATLEPSEPTPARRGKKRGKLRAIPSDRGTLELTSDPEVSVFHGEKRLGKTPLDLPLPPGSYELRLVNRAKFLEAKRTVEIRAGRATQRELSFGVGTLRVDAPEGTKLYLDAKYVGEAPFAAIPVAEGRHYLRLKRGEDSVTEWLEIPPSRTVEYRVGF